MAQLCTVMLLQPQRGATVQVAVMVTAIQNWMVNATNPNKKALEMLRQIIYNKIFMEESGRKTKSFTLQKC